MTLKRDTAIIKMHYSVKTRDIISVKAYGFLSFANIWVHIQGKLLKI